MSGFLLDTSALLTLRDNEPGANRISELLSDGSPCYGSFMTLMEVFYRVWKDEGETAGREAYTNCLLYLWFGFMSLPRFYSALPLLKQPIRYR